MCNFEIIRTLIYLYIELFTIYHQGRRRRGAGGHEPPPLSKVGAQVGLCPPPPTFGQSKCSNFTICSYFVVKNTFFFKIFLARFARQLY